ncbi:DUF2333 family protein [Halomonas sp. NO4]|uniref:DUF2333 family protein n=1 Tax=Halomonas sp. NO4 TaxID=2484813 RepID=UPI0013D284D7|nr:DUF2333 family protein [Halomonas sp. NO4]
MAFLKRDAGRPRSRADVLERPDYGWIWKPLLALAGIYLVVVLALGVWWSRAPAPFDVERATAAQRGAVAESGGQAATSPAARGAVTVATLMTTLDTLLDKPGGFLRNDVAPPGVWLDNMPAWEYGVLGQLRELAGALPPLADGEAASLQAAHAALMHDSRDWALPGTEEQLAAARAALGEHLAGLGADEGAFTAAGDGLAHWLDGVTGRLDALAQRLSASAGSREAVRLGVDVEALPEPTPWHRVDDIFFEARGSGWALIHLLEGVRRDHADVIAAAGATERWDRLLVVLERTQRRLWSPVVLNGSGFGVFANHSLVMANYLLHARDLTGTLAGALEGQSVEASDAETTVAPEASPAPATNDDGPSEDGPSGEA